MRRRAFDLSATVCIAVVNVVWSLLPYHTELVGIFLALPFIFVVPGYALTEAILPANAKSGSMLNDKRFTASSRLTFSIGLSIVIDVLGGFLLNLFPTGLRAVPWALFLALITLVFAGVALFRRSQFNNQNQGHVPLNTISTNFPRISLWQGSLFFFSLLIVVAAFAYAVNSARNQPYPGFTQLGILPPTAGEQGCTVHIIAQNFEVVPVSYHITMTTNGVLLKTWSDISMGYQQTWDQFVALPVSNQSKSVIVRAQLYRDDQPDTIYRKVQMTLSVEKGKSTAGNGSPDKEIFACRTS